MFELRTINRWTRLDSLKVETERRPHIVPLNDEAEEFVHYQLVTPYDSFAASGREVPVRQESSIARGRRSPAETSRCRQAAARRPPTILVRH